MILKRFNFFIFFVFIFSQLYSQVDENGYNHKAKKKNYDFYIELTETCSPTGFVEDIFPAKSNIIIYFKQNLGRIISYGTFPKNFEKDIALFSLDTKSGFFDSECSKRFLDELKTSNYYKNLILSTKLEENIHVCPPPGVDGFIRITLYSNNVNNTIKYYSPDSCSKDFIKFYNLIFGFVKQNTYKLKFKELCNIIRAEKYVNTKDIDSLKFINILVGNGISELRCCVDTVYTSEIIKIIQDTTDYFKLRNTLIEAFNKINISRISLILKNIVNNKKENNIIRVTSLYQLFSNRLYFDRQFLLNILNDKSECFSLRRAAFGFSDNKDSLFNSSIVEILSNKSENDTLRRELFYLFSDTIKYSLIEKIIADSSESYNVRRGALWYIANQKLNSFHQTFCSQIIRKIIFNKDESSIVRSSALPFLKTESDSLRIKIAYSLIYDTLENESIRQQAAFELCLPHDSLYSKMVSNILLNKNEKKQLRENLLYQLDCNTLANDKFLLPMFYDLVDSALLDYNFIKNLGDIFFNCLEMVCFKSLMCFSKLKYYLQKPYFEERTSLYASMLYSLKHKKELQIEIEKLYYMSIYYSRALLCNIEWLDDDDILNRLIKINDKIKNKKNLLKDDSEKIILISDEINRRQSLLNKEKK